MKVNVVDCRKNKICNAFKWDVKLVFNSYLKPLSSTDFTRTLQ